MSFNLNEHGRLNPGRQRTTLADIEDFFVKQAPFTERRQVIFRAFLSWIDVLRSLCPNVILWIDGGFVTYKDVPPKDIDVAAILAKSDLNSMDQDQQNTFMTLMTSDGADGARVQPMGGLVDGFFSIRGDVDQTVVWHNTWSAVYVDGAEVVGELKGYLEVRLSDA